MQRLISFTYVYMIPLFLSAIVSLRSFRLGWPKQLVVFAVFLLSTFVVEVFAISWKLGFCSTVYWNYSQSNLWIYNAFLTVRHMFILYFYYKVISFTKVRRVIIFSIMPFIGFALSDYIYFQTPHNVNNYTFVLANSFTIFLSLTFFYQVLRSDKFVKLSTCPEAWISLGLFIYHSGTIPLFILFNYLVNKEYTMLQSYLYINDGLNIIMYVLFIISFLCKPQYQK